jgi:hypothetical protein
LLDHLDGHDQLALGLLCPWLGEGGSERDSDYEQRAPSTTRFRGARLSMQVSARLEQTRTRSRNKQDEEFKNDKG